MRWQSLSAKTKKRALSICIALCCISGVTSLLAACGGSGGSATIGSTQQTPMLPTNTATLTQPASTSTPSVGTHSNGFQGVYLFGGALQTPQDFEKYVNNPSVVGVDVSFYWSDIQPYNSTDYRWNKIDDVLQQWGGAGKKVMLRVSTAGLAWGDHAPNALRGTPLWVSQKTDHGSRMLYVPEKRGQNGTAYLPQYWNPNFLYYYKQFIQALAKRYDNNDQGSNLSVMKIAEGPGGETKADTTASTDNPHLLKDWQKIGYTNQVWWETMQTIGGDYKASFHTKPLAIMPNASFIDRNGKCAIAGQQTPSPSALTLACKEQLVLDYAVSNQFWLQDNGLNEYTPTQSRADAWRKVPVIVEQLKPAGQKGQQSGTPIPSYPLKKDIQAAGDLAQQGEDVRCLLIFASDINNPNNVDTLAKAKEMVSSQNMP